MIWRRRPLLRAAMLGGAGYATYQAGTRGAERSRHQREQDADRLATLLALKELLDSGALTQQEFDAEKRRILRGETGPAG